MIEAYTDGACSGNPGPGGWGVLMIDGNNRQEFCGGEAETTNNRMELMAAIRALEEAPQNEPIKVTTDSQYVKNGVETWVHGWKRNGWKTASKKPVKNQDLWQTLDQLAQSRSVTWAWVKGHAGHEGNEAADALARQGMATFLST
ncbi:MAG: ribonuclease HI [Pseudomonadota bacterium]